MPQRSSTASWQGDLTEGDGEMELGSGAYEDSYSFASRFEDGDGTNPEELIAAAHAGCYAMALSHELDEAGYSPEQVDAEANVHLEEVGDDFAITTIELEAEADVPDIDEDTFQEFAEGAKEGCPVSKALAGPEIALDADLQ